MDGGHYFHNDIKMSGSKRTPFMIGVAGGTSSGKSSVCQKIMEQLGQADVSDSQRKVVCISQDSFYKKLNGKLTATNNYDHPNALDQDLLLKTLQDVLEGKMTEVKLYDYVKNAPREGEFVKIYPADVVLFEGILAFYFPQIRDLFDMKLFVDTDADTRLYRRVMRDVDERGRDLDVVLNHYMDFVKPSFEEFCLPSKKFADVIIPRGADNTGNNNATTAIVACVLGHCRINHERLKNPPRSESSEIAISLIVQHINDVINARKNAGGNSNGTSTAAPSRPANKRQLKKELSRPH